MRCCDRVSIHMRMSVDAGLCIFTSAHTCLRTYTYKYVYLCVNAYVHADTCVCIYVQSSHLGSKHSAETVVRTIMRPTQQSNKFLGATPPSPQQIRRRDIAPHSGVEPPAMEYGASPPSEMAHAFSDVSWLLDFRVVDALGSFKEALYEVDISATCEQRWRRYFME